MSDDLDGAIEACELGSEKWPNNPSPLLELSNLYATKGDYETAIMRGMRVIKVKPGMLTLAFKDSTYLTSEMRDSLKR